MTLDLATVDELLTTTRAVRKRLDLSRPVPTEVVMECLRLATQAPSAADVQNWRWLVVTDPGQRERIAALQAPDGEFLRGEVARLDDGPERRRFQSALHLVEHLHEVPVLVLAYAVDPDLAGLKGQQLPPALLFGSIYPAMWSFQLALRSRGLGTTPVFVADQAGLAEVVGAPDDAHFAGLMPVAYFTGTTFKPAARRPVEEVTFLDRWGTTAG